MVFVSVIVHLHSTTPEKSGLEINVRWKGRGREEEREMSLLDCMKRGGGEGFERVAACGAGDATIILVSLSLFLSLSLVLHTHIYTGFAVISMN